MNNDYISGIQKLYNTTFSGEQFTTEGFVKPPKVCLNCGQYKDPAGNLKPCCCSLNAPKIT